MKALTIESMLQIGWDCGLTHIDEAYSQIMKHYDCFFLIDKLHEQIHDFAILLEEAGLVEDCPDQPDKKQLKDMTIEEAAKQIGYTLVDGYAEYCAELERTGRNFE